MLFDEMREKWWTIFISYIDQARVIILAIYQGHKDRYRQPYMKSMVDINNENPQYTLGIEVS